MSANSTRSPLTAPKHGMDDSCDLRQTVAAKDETILELSGRISELQVSAAAYGAARARIETLSKIILNYHGLLRRLRLGALLQRLGWRNTFETAIGRIEAAGLFDAAWYLGRYRDVAASKQPPLTHYLLFGADEGRDPNPYFSSAWYLNANPDVAEQGLNPLSHYAMHGAFENRSFHPDFDVEAYAASFPESRQQGRTVLGHFLQSGAPPGPYLRRARAVRPEPPAWDAFEALAANKSAAPQEASGGAIVDVIVPVYRGYDETLACLYSVLAAPVQTAFEVIVIDDASPEPALSRALARLAGLQLISLIVQERNRGFVAAVNRGMQAHPGRDVILLNSDTVVYGNWLDRLRAHALGGRTGTVTPFSNNATICSYPVFCADNPAPLEIGYAEIDRLAAAHNAGEAIDVPTAVGFCMYIRREALSLHGYFDEAAFGLGYGEENDFSRRIAAQGWRNVMALDVFVRHSGETSFQGKASALRAKGLQTVLARYPDFHHCVQEHIARDDAAPARRRLDIARLKRHIGGRQTVVCLSHVKGGGIERHLRDKAARLQAMDRGLCVITPSTGALPRCQVNAIAPIELPNLSSLNMNRHTLAPILAQLHACEIEVHSLAGWPPHSLLLIPALARALDISFSVILHDYAPVCPMINLINETGLYCGEKGEAQCRACIVAQPAKAAAVHGPSPFDADSADITAWRHAYAALLGQAKSVIAPSHDTAARFKRYFPGLAIRVEPHEDIAPARSSLPQKPDQRSTPLHVLTIGAIGPHKGAAVLEACARDAAARRLPVSFTVIGYTDRDEALLALANVRVTGRYKEADVLQLLESQNGHIVFLPSVWPETYSYTLSIALAAGLPVAVFDLGAPAERLANDPKAIILPPGYASTPSRINDALLRRWLEGAP